MGSRAIAMVLAFAGLVAAADEGKGPGNVWSSIDVKLGARMKFDASWDDSNVTAGNYLLYVNQEGGTAKRNDNEFNMTANESRFWLELTGPASDSITTGGRLEFDFYGAGAAENKSHLMLRKLYFQFGLPEQDLSFLAGQNSDVISPLVMRTLNYTVGWDIGNIGYRRPQFRVTKGFKGDGVGVEIQGALTRTVGDTVPAALTGTLRSDNGEDAGFPTMQCRVGLTLPIAERKISFGVSGHYGQEQMDTGTFRGEERYDSWSINLDVKVPICPQLEFSGEAFWGANLDTYFGGIGQGVNKTLWREIRTRGMWAQLVARPMKDWSFAGGGGFDDPRDRDLNAGDREWNSFLFANFLYNLTANLQLGAEVGRYWTNYKSGKDGTDNRIQASMIFNF
ncbi:MAG: hypothetical protein JXP34_10825 [Planctomycetes bacterium]|nr:hypothetical protein [Planctomycetota bacterium]